MTTAIPCLCDHAEEHEGISDDTLVLSFVISLVCRFGPLVTETFELLRPRLACPTPGVGNITSLVQEQRCLGLQPQSELELMGPQHSGCWSRDSWLPSGLVL